jgi:diketogulonate reductase-like aldo/keto reductase
MDEPQFIYGTAWKEERTQALVELAISLGFRAIDTANQRRHYFEAAVGQAIAGAIEQGVVNRSDLWLQTKFTFQRGQDHRLPYDATAPIGIQVQQSFASSLQHLGTDTIDSYLLHGPTQRAGLAAADWEAWRAMEALFDRGAARQLGISNVSADQLDQLCQSARVKPSIVQNRCYAAQGWDSDVRQRCREGGIAYQAFSLLTANRALLLHPELAQIAARHGRTPSQIVFRFALEIGIIPLTGTTSAEHMRADLEALHFELAPGEADRIERLLLP